jgi:uncharacterized membrane protein
MLEVAMPYCNQCGNNVSNDDRFCAKCGATQSGASRQSPLGSSIDPKQAATLCYIPFVGWIISLVVLATGSYRQHHRTVFHAFQGLYLAIAWLLVDWLLKPMFLYSGMVGRNTIPGVIHAVILIAWIVTMIKVHQGEDPRIPLIGEIAEKSAQDHSGSRT